jgi:hypothetical protein
VKGNTAQLRRRKRGMIAESQPKGTAPHRLHPNSSDFFIDEDSSSASSIRAFRIANKTPHCQSWVNLASGNSVRSQWLGMM